MKKLLPVVLVAVLYAANVTAGGQICNDVAEYASVIMEKRQEGLPGSVMFEVAAQLPVPYLKDMVEDALAYPVFSDATAREFAIREFRSKWTIGCIRVFGI